eukprot:GHVT01054542.1.p2 GENE.GHVT01054542.1~~GHVT01054542.1.p2  ORF type:complete len:152 (+),score=10.68 GHVT01054542.1:881-1336(+)
MVPKNRQWVAGMLGGQVPLMSSIAAKVTLGFSHPFDTARFTGSLASSKKGTCQEYFDISPEAVTETSQNADPGASLNFEIAKEAGPELAKSLVGYTSRFTTRWPWHNTAKALRHFANQVQKSYSFPRQQPNRRVSYIVAKHWTSVRRTFTA